MADPWQLALFKRSVEEWNAWRKANPDIKVDLREANLREANLIFADLSGADLSGVDLRGALLSSARVSEADLSEADLTEVRTTEAWHYVLSFPPLEANLRGADLRGADLRHAYLIGATLKGATLKGAKLIAADVREAELMDFLHSFERAALTFKSTTQKPHQGQSSSTIDWLSLVETIGTDFFVTAATLASIIGGLDVIERRWRERKEMQQRHRAQMPQPSLASPTQPATSSPHQIPASDREIVEICLVMDDGSHHSFKRWVSNPDDLKTYIDAFSDSTSKVKPLQVIFKKHEGRALRVDVTEGGKGNRQLNVILSYLDADPQP